MKVILLKNVPKVGRKYEIKNVSDGFALNFLIPQKAAEPATGPAVKRVEALRAKEVADQKIREDLLMKNLQSIQNVKIEFSEKANDKGHLFSGIHKERLVEELKAQTRLDISPEFIDLAKPLKEVGEHKVVVKVGDKSAEFTVVISAA